MSFIGVTYTVGVRHRFIPFGWRKFHVVGHKELDGNRLRLVFPDTSVIIIPEMQKKWLKVFSDYATAEANLEKLKQRGAPSHAEIPTS